MTKIFEAFERAVKERRRGGGKAADPDSATSVELAAMTDAILQEKIVGLYHTLCALVPADKGRAIQFLSAHPGEGTSALARQLARLTATRLRKTVLFVDADPFSVGNSIFGITPPKSWLEAIEDGTPIQEVIHQVGSTRLHVTQISRKGVPITPFIDSGLAQSYLNSLKVQKFDLVILDTAAAMRAPDGVALAPRTDGVVLVVEAEKTRWQVTDSLKDNLEKHGGRVLGVVLSKRRHHIPRFIYRRL